MVIKWAITENCNLNCKNCYYSSMKGQNIELPLKDAKSIIDNISKIEIDNIQLMGGEPLEYKYINDIIDYIYDKGIKIWINTNFVNVTERLIKQIEHNKIDTIIISLDGATEKVNDFIRGNGVYKRVLNNIKKLALHNLKTKIYINSTLNKEGIENLFDFIDFAKSNPIVNQISISIPALQGNALLQNENYFSSNELYIEQIEKLLDELKKQQESLINKFVFDVPPYISEDFKKRFGYISILNKSYCMGGTKSYYLNPEGDLFPCNLNVGESYFKSLNPKNINLIKNDVEKVLSNEIFNEFYKKTKILERNNDINTICNKCKFYKEGFCLPSCPLESDNKYPDMCKYYIDKNSAEVNENTFNSKDEIISLKINPGTRWIYDNQEKSIEIYSLLRDKSYKIKGEKIEEVKKVLTEKKIKISSNDEKIELVKILEQIGVVNYHDKT